MQWPNLRLTPWFAAWRYGFAVAGVFAALLLRLAILPVESKLGFLLFYPAVTVAFLIGGTGPGRLAVALSAIVGYSIFESPHGSFGYSHEGTLSASVFIVSSLLIGWVVARLQATGDRLGSALAELHANASFLNRTGRVAGVGGWQLELDSQALTWSDETRRIHEVGPDFVPTLESAIAFYAPDAQQAIASAVKLGMERAEGWDLELPLTTATGRAIWVRAVGEVEFEGDKAVRLIGAFQDITDRKVLEQRLTDSERFVRLVTDSVPVRIAYTDPNGRYRFVNRAHCERFGVDREQVIGRTRRELRPEANSPVVESHLANALKGQAQHFEFEEPVGGSMRRIESQLIPDLSDTGAVLGYFSIGIDITERNTTERALRELTLTLNSVIEAIPATVAVIGRDGQYRFVNSAFERGAGQRRDQIIGRTAREVLGEPEFQRRTLWVDKALAGETVTFQLDYPGRDGTTYSSLSYIPLLSDQGAVDGFVAVTQDVTPQKREEGRLLQLAQRDPLTGLLNRAGFEQHLEHAARPGGSGSLALLYIDLDHFKSVNDRHGHPAGDQVLKIFGQRLVNLVRPSDAVARLGGDEFAIALSGAREGANAQAVADKVLSAAKAPFNVGALTLHIGASVGVAFSADSAIPWRDLIERADTRLLAAKAAGRGRQAGATG